MCVAISPIVSEAQQAKKKAEPYAQLMALGAVNTGLHHTHVPIGSGAGNAERVM